MLKQVDPEVAAAIRQETKRQAGKAGNDRLGELRQRGRPRGPGVRHDQQVRRGVPGQTILPTAASSSTSSSGWPSSGASSSSGRTTPTSRRTRAVQANMAVYFSVLEPGDTILGMNLSHGGHLSHGSPASFSGRFYKVVFYGVDRKTETHRLQRGGRPGQAAQARRSSSSARAPTPGRSLTRTSGRSPTRSGPGACRHRPHRRARRRRTPPDPRSPLRVRHDDHPQDPPGPPRRADPVQERLRPGPRQPRSSRGCRAARSCTSSPPRPWRSRRP